MGGDGNFWFTLSNSNEVARITPTGNISYFTTPTLSEPAFITRGPDGNIWFAEGSASRIASVTPRGVITEYQFSPFGVSVGITTGSDGNIWFTDQTDHAVWRFEIATGTFTEFRTPTPNSFPGDITTGSDGNMWFTEEAVDKFARVTPNGIITEFTGLTAPGSIAAGPDGNLWITSAFNPQVARVTPLLVQITIIATPTTPTIIRPGNANNLVFTESSANRIASITTAGVVTESQQFVHSAPLGITAGVGSRVWFLGQGTNRVYETVVPR
jgi:streptogramin lyase